MMENALKCMNNGAGIPLGYYVDDTQHLQIDEKKAPYVKEIFQRFADGEMIKNIIAELNARGATISYKLKKSRKEVKAYERCCPITQSAAYSPIENISENISSKML